MGKLTLIIEALYKGKALANSAYWKNVQDVLNSIFVVLLALRAFLPEELQEQFTDESLRSITNTIAIIGIGINNAYFIRATSEKVGFTSGNS